MKNTIASIATVAVVFVALGGWLGAFGSGATQSQDHSNTKLEPRSFAFIELFTSEGCHSCPSADKNLERIAANAARSGQEVYTLSYHVDYWNYLGWKDPYSDSQFSARQQKYAQQFKSSRVYTPQMVVNGKSEFVGSNRKSSDRAVKVALGQQSASAVTLSATLQSDQVNVDWKATGIEANDVVNFALVQNSGKQDVSRGENARRKLTHVNIVRKLKTVKSGAGGKVQFELPKEFAVNNFHVVAFTQSGADVTSAAKCKIKASSAKSSLNKTTDAKVQPVAFTAHKPQVAQDAKRSLVSEQRFLQLLSRDSRQTAGVIGEARNNWDVSYVPMLLEAARFLPTDQRALVMNLVEDKTGQRFGRDTDKWLQWSWKQKFEPHPGYGKFKSALYQQIDPRFAEYFADTKNATIRLDEIRWGGVRRDGIPPLKDPKMLAATDAHYLADTDVVFGIELNGDARAYPKRILAWHEMFKDTIGGESVCGVY